MGRQLSQKVWVWVCCPELILTNNPRSEVWGPGALRSLHSEFPARLALSWGGGGQCLRNTSSSRLLWPPWPCTDSERDVQRVEKVMRSIQHRHAPCTHEGSFMDRRVSVILKSHTEFLKSRKKTPRQKTTKAETESQRSTGINYGHRGLSLD